MLTHTDDLLRQSDEDLFTKGGCHVFAACLAETYGYPLRLLRDTSVPEPGGIVHVYCLPAADVMIDFTGVGSERSYLRSKCYDFAPYQAETVTLQRIGELSVNEYGCGGLYSEPRFVAAAEIRALAAIAAARRKYGYPERDRPGASWSAIKTVCCSLVLICALVACSDDRKVVLSDEIGSRTLVYKFGKGFIPQARVPDDLPVLFHSGALAMNDAAKENDFVSFQALQRVWKEKDYRALEKSIVEFRFQQLEGKAK